MILPDSNPDSRHRWKLTIDWEYPVPKRKEFGPRKARTVYRAVLEEPLHARRDDWGGCATSMWTAILWKCDEDRARDAYDVVLNALLETDAKGRGALLILEQADLVLAEWLDHVRNGNRLPGAVR